MATGVTSVYLHVVDDVISKVREDFLNFGVGDNILNELQGLWEMKMMQCGAISGNTERPSFSKANGAVAPVHDLNVPYEGPTEEYETPTAEMLFPPTPMQTPIPTPLPGISENQMYTAGTPNDFESTDDTRDGETKPGRPNPYMHPPSPWMTQRPLGVDVNIAYDEGQADVDRGAPRQPRTQDFFMGSSGKRKRGDYVPHLPPDGFIPQQDGACDVTVEFLLPEGREMEKPWLADGSAPCQELRAKDPGSPPVLPQLDGINDDYDSSFNAHGDPRGGGYQTPSEQAGTPRTAQAAGGEGDEPPLNEDDDDDEDDLDDLDQEEEEPNTQHLVLALFDKARARPSPPLTQTLEERREKREERREKREESSPSLCRRAGDAGEEQMEMHAQGRHHASQQQRHPLQQGERGVRVLSAGEGEGGRREEGF